MKFDRNVLSFRTQGYYVMNCHFVVLNDTPMTERKGLLPKLMGTVGALCSPGKCWPDALDSEMPSGLCKYN